MGYQRQGTCHIWVAAVEAFAMDSKHGKYMSIPIAEFVVGNKDGVEECGTYEDEDEDEKPECGAGSGSGGPGKRASASASAPAPASASDSVYSKLVLIPVDDPAETERQLLQLGETFCRWNFVGKKFEGGVRLNSDNTSKVTESIRGVVGMEPPFEIQVCGHPTTLEIREKLAKIAEMDIENMVIECNGKASLDAEVWTGVGGSRDFHIKFPSVF